MSNQKLIGLIALYLLMVGIILAGIIIVLPDAPFEIAVGAAVIASTLICGMAVNFAGQSGGLTAQNFFAASVARNSRAVIVLTNPADLKEVLFQLNLAGLQPSVVTA